MARHPTAALSRLLQHSPTRLISCLLLALAVCNTAIADVLLTEGTNISVDVKFDANGGSHAVIDLLGDIWVLPADGGEARKIEGGLRPAKRPHWSPDGNALVYQASRADNDELWLHRFDNDSSRRLGEASNFDQQPSWHPDGERIVFSSARKDSGFDIWEIDVATQLVWRLTHLPGDETEPAWSSSGRDLLYVYEHRSQWSLMLRRRGEIARPLATSKRRIAAPSWRPDGSLVTYMIAGEDSWSVRMIILSQPLLDRAMIDGEDFFLAPVTWLDRQQMLYTANGHIRKRQFNAWTSADVPFRAMLGSTSAASDAPDVRPDLPRTNEPTGITVIRAGRVYDGIGKGYRNNPDIVIDGGRIVAIEEQRPRDGVIVVDLGDLTVLPGFIDAYASLPAATTAADGPLILGLGVTTLAAELDDGDKLNEIWSGKEIPGPRILSRPSLQQTYDPGETVWSWRLAGAQTAPVSPLGHRYQDTQITSGPVVVGSAPNELPPGTALHAELRALVNAGLTPEQALQAAGINAATELGLNLRLGQIATGAVADLVLVDGDPLADIGAAARIVGIVRNGRFFSVSGLADRAKAAQSTVTVE